MSALPSNLVAIGGDLPAYVFLTYQQECMASTALHGVTLVEKSRRTGYSWAAGAIAVLTAAAARAAGGMSVYYMGYNLEMAREFIDYCGEWAKTLQAAAGAMEETFFTDPDHPDKQIKAFRVEFASGFEVVALPSVARALRGKQGLVILDEAAFHDDLEAVITAALALRMWGGRLLIISTHNGDTSYFNTLVNEVRAGKKPYHLLRCTFDDAVAQGLVKRIFKKIQRAWSPEAEAAWIAETLAEFGDAAAEELFCIPSDGSGTALPRALIEKRMVVDGPVIRLSLPDTFTHLPEAMRRAEIADWCREHLDPVLVKLDPATPHVFGEDFARSGDLTVIAPLAIEKSLVRRCPFLIELRNVPFEQQAQILFYMADRLPRLRAGKLDATGNGSYLAEVTMQRFGEGRIERVMLNEPWYRENMPAFKAAFEDGTIELPRDRDVMDDLRVLAMVRGVMRVPELRTKGTDGRGRHGDAAVALALAYAASRAEVEEYAYQGGVKRPAGIGFGNTGAQPRWRDTPDPDEDMPRAGGRMGILPDLRAL